MTTANEVPSTTGIESGAKPSPGRAERGKSAARPTPSKQAAAKQVASLRPANLEEARREILRLVCLNSVAITQIIVDDALEGKCPSAKFLFEAVGLCAGNAEELENPERRESLASLLLKRWQLAPQTTEIGTAVDVQSAGAKPAGEKTSDEITEVPQTAAVVDAPTDAPVES